MAVLFCDFDGPIVDVSERYYRTYQMGLQAVRAIFEAEQGRVLPLQILSKQQFWWMKRNRVSDLEIATRSGLSDALVSGFLEQVQRIVNHPHLLRLDLLQPTAYEAIAQVKRQGVRLVLVTLRHPRQVQAFLQTNDLSQDIDEIFGESDVYAAQANRVEQKVALLKRAIASQTEQGYSTTGAWMVGDTEADIVAGQATGLETAALTCGIRSPAYLKQFNPTTLSTDLLSAITHIKLDRVLQAA